MRVSNEQLEEISRSNDIIEVISSYLQLKKRGKSFIGLCPFHPDKHPSLHVSQDKQLYHCFSCKASGNVFNFIQNFEKITFMDAVEKLAERAGIELKKYGQSPDRSDEFSVLLEINKAAAIYFRNNLEILKGNEKEFINNYLKSRNIDNKISARFGIGYAGKSWDGLLNHFIEEGIFKSEDVEKAGLIIRNETGKYYDRFRGRLMFPVFNESGKVVAFGGRKLFDDDTGGKYINSPETKVYVKSKILYGLNFAKEIIRSYDYLILVEGYMDLISLVKHGFENVVASSGTALTEEQVRLISRYTSNIYMLFDSDLAGIKASKRGIEIILEAGLDVDIINLPEGEDPDSFINKFGKDSFAELIENRKSIINFVSELYRKEGKLNTVREKSDFVKEIIGYIGKIPDKIKRAFFIKEISVMYSLYESDLRDELEKNLRQNQKNPAFRSSVILPVKRSESKNSDIDEISNEEQDLIELFINGDEEAVSYIENNLEISFLKNNYVASISEYFLDEYINHGKLDLAKALNDLEKEEERIIISKIALNKHEISTPRIELKDSILNSAVNPNFNLKFAKDLIKKFRLRELELKRNELKKNPDNLMEVFELTKKINELNNADVIKEKSSFSD